MKNAMSRRVIALVMIGSMIGTTTTQALEVKKDESVYVNLNSDGEMEKYTVSDWIHSDKSGSVVYDKSELNNIKNVKSDIKPNKSGESLIWDMEGSDLYYQGTTNKDIPIDVNIKYYYEDKEIEPEDLAGKSGKVKIEININNKSSKEVEINGKQRNIYTPFLVAGEISFPNDKFSNITTDGGVMISEGNNDMVTFTKTPGIKDSLEFDSIPFDKNLEKFDKIKKMTDGKITVEADVEEFSLGPIMIMAASDSSILEDLDSASNLSEYRDMLSQMKDNYDKIIEGETKLNDGISKGYSAFEEGISKINEPKIKEKISLITNQYNVNRSNKLLDDADFTVKMPTDKVDSLLNQVQSNWGQIDNFAKNKDKNLGYLKAAGALLNNT